MDTATIIDLRLGDCLEGMRVLATGSIDVVVTSPPYNLGIRYAHYRDDVARPLYLEWCMGWAKELRRVLKPNGSFFLNIGASPGNPLLPHQLALRFSSLFVLQNTIHWIKSITVETGNPPSPLSVGHFKPINSNRYLNDCHEYLFHFTPHGRTPIHRRAIGVPYSDKSNILRWQHTSGEDCRCRGNTWYVPYDTIRSRARERPHPATFPPRLAAMALRLHGVTKESIVLDPFMGLGNSGIAARECGVRHFIGFEIDPCYFAEAQYRLAASCS